MSKKAALAIAINEAMLKRLHEDKRVGSNAVPFIVDAIVVWLDKNDLKIVPKKATNQMLADTGVMTGYQCDMFDTPDIDHRDWYELIVEAAPEVLE